MELEMEMETETMSVARVPPYRHCTLLMSMSTLATPRDSRHLPKKEAYNHRGHPSYCVLRAQQPLRALGKIK